MKKSHVIMYSEGLHPSKETVIKTGNVDINIVSLVNWLNEFPSVITVCSCEGDSDNSKKEMISLPQVGFMCGDYITLCTILEQVYGFQNSNCLESNNYGLNVSVSWMPNMPSPVIYGLSFASKKSLLKFIKWMRL